MTASRSRRVDPVTFEVIWHRLLDITEEMGISYLRTSGSQVLITGNDASTGITLPDGSLVAMGPYITTQGNVLPLMIDNIQKLCSENPGIHEGDMFICNDPYLGATHQPDVATLAPVFHQGQLVAWVGASGHWLDIGGIDAGGFSMRAREVHEEGLRMPGVKIVERDELREDIYRWIMNQVRDPLTGLDIRGQIAANNAGRERLAKLFQRYGYETVRSVMEQSLDYVEERLRARLRELPDGVWREVQYIDHDGHEPNVFKLVCTMTKQGDQLRFDFTGTDPQARGFINCTYSGLRAGVLTAVYILLCYDLPWNQGVARCVELASPGGIVCDCTYPAPCSMATISTIIMVVNLAFGCLTKLLAVSGKYSEEAMAVWTGTSLAPVIAGTSQHGFPFAATEMSHFAGGTGARTYADGEDTGGIIFNTTPHIANVETFEQDHPVLYLFRRQLRDSGGPGKFRGGASGELAIIQHDAPKQDLQMAFSGGGAEMPNALGLAGGMPGATVRHIRVTRTDVRERIARGEPLPASLDVVQGERQVMPQKHPGLPFELDDVWYHSWQGGGGYGDPLDRDPRLMLRDVMADLVSEECAREIYGVEIDRQARVVDEEATKKQRSRIREARLRAAGAGKEGAK